MSILNWLSLNLLYKYLNVQAVTFLVPELGQEKIFYTASGKGKICVKSNFLHWVNFEAFIKLVSFRGVLDVGFPIFADTDADYAF